MSEIKAALKHAFGGSHWAVCLDSMPFPHREDSRTGPKWKPLSNSFIDSSSERDVSIRDHKHLYCQGFVYKLRSMFTDLCPLFLVFLSYQLILFGVAFDAWLNIANASTITQYPSSHAYNLHLRVQLGKAASLSSLIQVHAWPSKAGMSLDGSDIDIVRGWVLN